jgi:Arc/MetJ-type ribon-helix-helix transcriptional regulator
MAIQIAVRIPDDLLAALDRMVATGHARSRAEAVRNAVELLARVEREREIADEYARAYGEAPQEDWVGRAGLALGAALQLAERDH